MVRGEKCWKEWAVALRIQMMQNRVPEVTKSIAEIKQETGTPEPLRNLHSQDFWIAYRDGHTDWDTLVRAGFVLKFKPNTAGGVENVTFRLNQTWQDILQKAVRNGG